MVIKGRLTQIEYVNKSTGIATVFIQDFESKEIIRAHGPLINAKELETYELTGNYAEDGSFRFAESTRSVDGRQESIDILVNAGIAVSNALAGTIVDTLGDNIYDYTALYPSSLKDFLMEIKGVGEKKAESIINLITSGQAQSKAFEFMSRFGVGYAEALQFLKDAKVSAIAKLKANPYILMKYHVPFAICDRMSKALGIDDWDPVRIDGVIDNTIRNIKASGSTRVEEESFGKLAGYTSLKDDRTRVRVPEDLTDIFTLAADRFETYTDGDHTYFSPKSLFDTEMSIAKDLLRIHSSKVPVSKDATTLIPKVEERLGITFTDEQKCAFKILETGGIGALTGGPGCGKTTTIAGIVCAYKMIHPDTNALLLAPTGRAAARLSELSGVTAKTIHKGLGLTWYSKDCPIIEPLSYDFIIIDETSMADTEITGYLLSAIKNGTTVLFAGDYNQLPSVGPGRVFKDLCECEVFPVFKLIESHRQKEGSSIIKNALGVLDGVLPEEAPDFRILYRDTNEEILEEVLREGYSEGTQILCPVKKGVAGTDRLNREIQKTIPLTGNSIWLDGTRYREGDLIIMNNNRYDLGYMNGDIGRILSIKNGILTIAFMEDTLSLDLADCEGMRLAYALTVHKAQGSEADKVILALPREAISLAKREVLFTAITRAKKEVVIISTPDMLRNYISNKKGDERDCGLKTIIKSKFSGNI